MTTQQYHHLLEHDIGDTVGLSAMPPREQDAFIAQIGETILDAALLRLVTDLSDEQGAALAHYLEDEPPTEVLLKHLFDQYPQFEAILTEEIIAFKEETVALFGGLEADTGIPAAAEH